MTSPGAARRPGASRGSGPGRTHGRGWQVGRTGTGNHTEERKDSCQKCNQRCYRYWFRRLYIASGSRCQRCEIREFQASLSAKNCGRAPLSAHPRPRPPGLNPPSPGDPRPLVIGPALCGLAERTQGGLDVVEAFSDRHASPARHGEGAGAAVRSGMVGYPAHGTGGYAGGARCGARNACRA
jgi:hypothetical protein